MPVACGDGLDAELIQAIGKAVRREAGEDAELRSVEITPLLGGSVARLVQRIDATLALPEGHLATRSFVQKHTVPREIAILRLLRPLAVRCAFPEPYADGTDANGAWVLSPFINGATLRDQYLLPPDVLNTLLTVHGAFASRLAELHFLPQLNRMFWLGLLDRSAAVLAGVDWPESEKSRLAATIGRLRESETVARALLSLPQTLTHSDVHGNNMIVARPPDGRTYLIDWGNARVGPAAVDMANCVASPHDPAWREYWARAAAAGHGLSDGDQRIAFLAATAQINVQYLPYAIGARGPAHALRMAKTALRCQAALA